MTLPTLENIPGDLFVEIARHMDVKDVHSLLAVSVTVG
jgi:hypothetical protein